MSVVSSEAESSSEDLESPNSESGTTDRSSSVVPRFGNATDYLLAADAIRMRKKPNPSGKNQFVECREFQNI